MSKRIAFCTDGTWDNSTSHSNVYLLYKSLLVTSEQVPIYDDGVVNPETRLDISCPLHAQSARRAKSMWRLTFRLESRLR